MLATVPLPAEGAPLYTDIDILNFALNLEYLESEFYTFATQGVSIEAYGIPTQSGICNYGPTYPVPPVNLSSDPIAQASAFQIAADERAHVLFIRNAIQSLGGTPIAKPTINLNALGISTGNIQQFAVLGRRFEDVGLSAYNGAAPLIQDKAVVLANSAKILGTEGNHVGSLRTLVLRTGADGIDQQLGPMDSLDKPVSQNQVFNVDQNGLTVARTTQQVLYIVFGKTPGVTSGGFFPNGVNSSNSSPLFTTSSGPA